MTSELITGISELTTLDAPLHDANIAPVLHDAAIVIDDGLIAWVGPAAHAPAADRHTDLEGRAVLPGWVDSHTHLVFDGDRSAEFAARMAGESYQAGGISVTTDATRSASDDRLDALITARIDEARRGGTTYIETKTGYGLSIDQEARAARIASRHADEVTFLGAHLVPDGQDADLYTEDVAGPMLDAVITAAGESGGSRLFWADVFCERGAFNETQSHRVLTAAKAAGLGLRVHGNQLGPGPGVRLAVECGAASVDHVNYLSDGDVDALAGSGGGHAADGARAQPGWETVATVLPACDLSTRAPLAPARRLLDAGVSIALASNCNPGTSYTTSMSFCVSTAVLQMGLSIAEAVAAATLGGARALRRDAESLAARTHPGPEQTWAPIGRITPGHRADLHVLNAPAAIHLAYRPGMPMTHSVWRAGERIV
ncbi:amidohydrolase family protein [Devriesea agamarum]|uniref:amidohydrolase family protein n=1 Tax=Devriesea agamarum TaxID=472569 RepID=UPI00071CCBBA|nr:amidohydrolase family protein [Devriesea agamarum]